MLVNVLNLQTDAVEQQELPDAVFGVPYNEPLIHQVVVAYQAAGRAGTVAQKSRSEVRGGGKKPWRQKGTGRARAGTSRSPIWRGGGRNHAAKPRSYVQKVNKQMYRGAMRSLLSELMRQETMKVVDGIVLAEPKTKLGKALISKVATEKVLVMADSMQENALLGLRNLPWVKITTSNQVSPADLVHFSHVLVSKETAMKLGEALQ